MNTMRILLGIVLLLVGLYYGLQTLATPVSSAVQQAVTAVWGVASISALGFAGLLLFPANSVAEKKATATGKANNEIGGVALNE